MPACFVFSLPSLNCTGPVQVNPLSLLGQYSDEDEEEEAMLANGSSGGVSAVAVAGQVDEQVQVHACIFACYRDPCWEGQETAVLHIHPDSKA